VCGIVGLVRRSGVALTQLEELTSRLAHRGPDGHGTTLLNGGRVGLGHRRLAILDLSPAGAQPMSDETGTAWITYNGEIFNFRELREQLRAQGHTFRTETDTEVLLTLYRREGLRMLARLRGMYAFVLHDTRSGETFYARDPIGIKPLYLRELDDGVALASEPDVLRGLGATSIDMLSLLRALMLLYPPGPRFGLREVRRVAPGEVGRIDPDGKITLLPFGPILPDLRGPGSLTRSPETTVLTDDLRSSVREHLTADVPVGLAFSGGLDSSVLARLVSEESTRPVRLFSFVSQMADSADRLDDRDVTLEAARRLGFEVSEVEFTGALVPVVDRMVGAIGEPVADPAAIAFLRIAERARAEGRYVMLSGHGADELLAGYRRHIVAATLLDRPRLARIISLAAAWFGGDLNRIHKIFRERPDYWPILLQCVLCPADLHEVLVPELANTSLEDLFDPLMNIAGDSAGASGLRRAMHLDFNSYLPDQNLNHLDKVSMAFGVEGRVPYLTPPVVSTCAYYSDAALIESWRGKAPLRKIAAELGVVGAAAKPKRGFGIPLTRLVSDGWDDIRARLTDPRAPGRMLWNPALLRRIQDSSISVVDPRIVLTMLVIDRWMEYDRSG
jgi:asparagine synthase (glutamine-hydrolysing)